MDISLINLSLEKTAGQAAKLGAPDRSADKGFKKLLDKDLSDAPIEQPLEETRETVEKPVKCDAPCEEKAPEQAEISQESTTLEAPATIALTPLPGAPENKPAAAATAADTAPKAAPAPVQATAAKETLPEAATDTASAEKQANLPSLLLANMPKEASAKDTFAKALQDAGLTNTANLKALNEDPLTALTQIELNKGAAQTTAKADQNPTPAAADSPIPAPPISAAGTPTLNEKPAGMASENKDIRSIHATAKNADETAAPAQDGKIADFAKHANSQPLPNFQAQMQAQNGNQVPANAQAATTHNAAAVAAPVADQVAFQISKSLKGGMDRIKIQLSPEDLGRVEIKLDMKDGHVKAVVAADKPETLQWLQRDAKSLERALNDAGFKLDSNNLSFNLRQDNGNAMNHFQAFQDARNFNESNQGRNGYAHPANEDAAIAADEKTVNYRYSASGVDIRV